jgi:hypothetical protein
MARHGYCHAVRIFANVLLFVVIGWLIFGGMFAFLGHMGRQGLAAGSNKTVQDLTRRQERWAGKAASVMYRRLWPVPVLALAGYILIAANYRI